ncbi:MAG: acetylornithine transaminase, partial [Pseudomonadota bacterium]
LFINSNSMSNSLMSNDAPLSVGFESGHGATLIDTDGNEYLDALSGIAVCLLGHAHPAIRDAVADQLDRVIHTSNIYQIPLQEQLAEKLISHSGMENVFFGNSGAEANEAAIKLARLFANKKGINSQKVIVMHNSFHGRTMATLSATGSEKVKQGFAPLVEGFLHIPYNDIDALHEAANDNKDIVAVMLEPIQGEGGIHVPAEGYLKDIRECCDRNDWLMIVDEVQTGMCRTGKWFAFQHENILPDIMTLAKSLANGVPIGACLARGKAAQLFKPGSHGSTFGGNPLSSRAALAVIHELEKHKMEERAAQLGEIMLQGFIQALHDVEGIHEIRGKGLMLGIELTEPCPELVELALNERLLINVTAGNIIRLLPPLIITNAEANQIVDTLSQLINDYLHSKSK